MEEIVITPPRAWTPLNLKEAWKARFLLWNLIRRNVKVAYADLNFGMLWSLGRPVLFVMVFVFIKNRSGAQLAERLPYALFLYTGLILWWYFTNAAKAAAKAVFKDRSLITKVYYPRIITPVVPVISSATELLLQLAMIPAGMLGYGIYPDWRLLLLPLVIAHVMVLALAVGFIVSAVSLESQDYMSILDYLLYVGMFLSPVIFSPSLLHGPWQAAYFILNPMVAPLEMFRAVFFEPSVAPWFWWSVSAAFSLLLLVAGAYLFRKVESHLADYVL